MTLEDQIAALTAKLTSIEEKASAAAADGASAAEAKAVLDEITPEIELIKAERKELEEQKAAAATTEALTTLGAAVTDIKEQLRKPSGTFVLPTSDPEGKGVDSDDPYQNGHSIFFDIKSANKGNKDALERLSQGVSTGDHQMSPEGKAMSEGVDANGGYLVRPAIERQIVIARENDNVLRGLCSTLNMTSKSIGLEQLGLATTAGWVAEGAVKPEGISMTSASIQADVFTAAGLATISNQLLADSNPAVDQLVLADLAKKLVAVEEDAFLNGNGSGKPFGILNTAGVGTTTFTGTTVEQLLGAILDSVAAVESGHGTPTAILMHPRTWNLIIRSQDAQGAYFIDPAGGPQDPRTGLRGPVKSLWGYRVVTSNRIPTNLGGTTNESRILVGDFAEALILDRQGITYDESPHVYFTSNQTVFRAEMRVGFTAARTPLAFNVIGGSGLAGK